MKELKTAFLKSLPVMAGYMILGIGFGIIWTSNGLNPLIGILMSVFLYAGSMQYVSVSLVTTGASVLSIIVMTLAVNIRHFFYSISMLNKYKDTGKFKPYLIFALTDETFSIACNGGPQGLNEPSYYFWLSLFNQSYWVLGTVIGVVLGNVNISFKGLEFAMTALFVVTCTDQILSKKNIPASVLGIIIPFLCLLTFGTSSFLIPSLILMSLILGIYCKKSK